MAPGQRSVDYDLECRSPGTQTNLDVTMVASTTRISEEVAKVMFDMTKRTHHDDSSRSESVLVFQCYSKSSSVKTACLFGLS
jgi:hypothetical protein